LSAKWIRVKKWDDQHLTGWLLPVKWVLRAFSSITLAVVLMSLLALYGTLASVPIGLLAMIPAWILFALPLFALFALATWGSRHAVRLIAPKSPQLSLTLGLSLFTSSIVSGLWGWLVWPYHPGSGQGFVPFASLVYEYRGTTIRRLPGVEMSELEFYAWWPLNTILYLFVINMIVATVRRIAVVFENIGVMAVHTGIVLLSLGSAIYSVGKQEGDALLLAGPADPQTGVPAIGKAVDFFYDNTATAITIRQRGKGEQQRRIAHLPRYNAYGLNVLESAVGRVPIAEQAQGDAGRQLAIELPRPEFAVDAVDADVNFRIVGYAPYAPLKPVWRPIPPGSMPWTMPSTEGAPVGTPLRFVKLIERGNPETGQIYRGEAGITPVEKVRDEFELTPSVPAGQLATAFDGMLHIEYTRGLDERRWNELTAPLPEGAAHGMIVEIPAGAGRPALSRIYPATPGRSIIIDDFGPLATWQIEVKSLSKQPQLPILTKGYENAQSSQLIARVSPPPTAGLSGPFERHVLSRFPQLAQDFPEGQLTPDGRPKRTDASGAIRLTYIDASKITVLLDELPGQFDEAGKPKVRAALRMADGGKVQQQELATGQRLLIGPPLAIELGDYFASAERVAVPVPVPLPEQNKDNVGNHRNAAIALEISTPPTDTSGPFTRTFWVPHSLYFGFAADDTVAVALPDGRTFDIGFNRLRRALPGMVLQLVDFEMIPYPHSTQPRDYRSDLFVYRGPGVPALVAEARFAGFDAAAAKYTHAAMVTRTLESTSLNEPLLAAPKLWSDSRSFATNASDWFTGVLGVTRFKFSQSGWDNRGWTQSKQQADAGQIKRAAANFTILGVGNNPGITIVAIGAVTTSMGIPWALWLKPWLVQRKKLRIQQQLKDGTYVRPLSRTADPAAAARTPPSPAEQSPPTAETIGNHA